MSTDTSTRSTEAGSAGDDGPLLASRLVRWLEDGVRRDDLFADDLFTDLSLPQWRIQGTCADDAYRIREAGHPFPGKVRVERLEPTSAGFLLEFEERWHADGQDWYCREMMHAAVSRPAGSPSSASTAPATGTRPCSVATPPR